ncbi:DEAD/DEAH box helicase family protein [Mucilaginibacter aquaedulcis]|uniref:DEAD/DEAH box helicase family protein n=1 Tax=Mucilaginibacter aquaedulcis TaxID=1187081 RepID=UPI0025B356A7|nr:DEAD/DEAH box helicase family protein [Mucilaginibacter aquaedulcis]MDN3548928.1 DEAD/DEAH box helicase family protein [Mucilaginibacter aquaedulcis]
MSSLRPYQLQAANNWKEAGYKGLLEMATGTGKTLTALSCARLLLEERGNLIVIILVPTLDLATQWATETRQLLMSNVLLANSKNNSWYKEVLMSMHSFQPSFSIITTYATFLTGKFQHLVKIMPSDTLIIADEVHNFGTLKHIAAYPLNISYRLGLSATPERYFDAEGSKALYDYFNIKDQPTFKFTMSEAIENGYLCEYYYYPKIVSLTDEELAGYKEISRKLMRFFNSSSQSLKDNSAVTSLLLKRKRIIHNASNKLKVFREIMTELVENHTPLKYLLVYVPEGNDKQVDEEDQRLIDTYSAVIAREFRLNQHQFIGGTLNRDKILGQFASGAIDVLTAMKCLDEGVDVRRAEIAIFCSSTGNPRQFIQRRGRILRTHPQKKFAIIFDMVVVPEVTNQYFEDTLLMEKSILQNELKRVHEFAGLALNHYQALDAIDEKAKEFDIDIFSKLT